MRRVDRITTITAEISLPVLDISLASMGHSLFSGFTFERELRAVRDVDAELIRHVSRESLTSITTQYITSYSSTAKQKYVLHDDLQDLG
jgi:hypothetical protein